MSTVFIYKIACAIEATGEVYHDEVRAMATATPGIILTETTMGDTLYRLTHAPSGMGITGTSSDVFGLLELAADLAAATDWTQDAKVVCTAEVGKAVKAAIAASGSDIGPMVVTQAMRDAANKHAGIDPMMLG